MHDTHEAGPRFDSASVLMSLQDLWSVDIIYVTLPHPLNETLKWLS